jgi:tetratricopeptide (TPR) repeat protein
MSAGPGGAALPKAPSNQRTRERLQPQEDMEFDEPAPRRSSSRRRPSSEDGEPGGLRGMYLRIPAKVRNTGLVLVLLVGGAAMYTRNHSEAALDREIAAIRKLQSDGKTSEAIVLAEELKKNWGGHSKPEALLGDLLIDQGKLDLALAAYRSAHKLSPPFPLIHVKLIRASLKAGDKSDIKDELAHIDAQIKDGPEIKDVFLETGRLFLDFKELEQPPEKTIILAKALQNKIAPDSSTGYILEAQTLIQMQRPQEAVPVMEKGWKVEPENDWLLENLVYARLAAQDFPGATATAQTWIKLKPTATKALLVMAYLNYNSKNYAAGLPFLDKLFEIASGTPNEPHHPEALNLQGQIFSQLGKLPEAAAAYKKACEAGFSQACDNELVKNAPPGVPGATTAPQPASLPNGAAPGNPAPEGGGVPSLDNPAAADPTKAK